MIDLMENITIPMNIKDVSVYVADKFTEISREEENSEVAELLSEINTSKESIESKQSEIDELLINHQDLINRGLSIIEESKYAYDTNTLNEEINDNTNDDISEVVEEVPINNELPADIFDDSAPLEEEKEEKPEEEVVTEISQEEPVQDEVVEQETTEVQLPTVEEENQEEAEVSLPAVDENQEEAVNETEVQYMRDSDNNTDKAVSITNDQKVKLDASYDTQKALLDGGSAKEEGSETPVVEAPSAEETPIAVELPVVENATVNTESNPQEELEKMSQEYSAALASGDEAKAEELSNAISEKNKQLQKVA